MPKSTSLIINIGQGLSMVLGLPTIPTWKSSHRPKKAKPGTFGFNTQTNKLEYCDGNSWYTAVMDEV